MTARYGHDISCPYAAPSAGQRAPRAILDVRRRALPLLVLAGYGLVAALLLSVIRVVF